LLREKVCVFKTKLWIANVLKTRLVVNEYYEVVKLMYDLFLMCSADIDI